MSDIKADTSILWPPDTRADTGKVPDAGKYWRQKEKEAAEDEMIRLSDGITGHEFEQTLKR